MEPDIDREALLLVSHSAISQLAIKEEDQSGAFTYVSVEPENKVGVPQVKILGKNLTVKGTTLK